MSKTAASPAFTGFTADAFRFFRDLAKNNNREWFQSHKALFEDTCREPLQALTVALHPPHGANRMTRIHRDVRFSKDKSPYRTHISTMLPSLYLFLSADGLYVGTGVYMPEPPVLRKLREAIDDDTTGRKLTTIVSVLREKGYDVKSHETVASAPRGYQTDHPRIDLLRMKDLHAGTTLKPSELATSKAVDQIRKIARDIDPLREWLLRNVGTLSCS